MRGGTLFGMLARTHPDLVTTARSLTAGGVGRSQLAAELAAGRWRRAGLAIVLHNGPLSRDQELRVAQIHAGPRSLFTAFTAAELLGLQGWKRAAVHLLAPAGTRPRAGSPVAFQLHLHGAATVRRETRRSIEALPDALLRAGATFRSPRPACGLLAAAVQQERLSPKQLDDALRLAPRVKHRAQLVLAVADIAGGSQALSEIDFVRLCRRHGLPEPQRQQVRWEPSGRRRYLDASWRRRDGRLVVAEVDGALHLIVKQWWDDQLRQNELALADALVLRYPSVIVRTREDLIANQLRRALWL
jgi:hypothetical protein